MTRALVLGCTGMVGRVVVQRLRALEEVDLVTAARSGDGADLAVDARDPVGLETALAGVDVVVNAIGLLRGHPAYPGDEYRLEAAAVNSVFPLRLADAAARAGARVVHISTDAVFAPEGPPADELAAVGPAEPYGQSKALGEPAGEHVLNVRCSVIGPAPERRSGLWGWIAAQPRDATVTGYAAWPWAGCTSTQLAHLCGDLVPAPSFAAVRATGAVQHFAPNEPATKHAVLSDLARRIRPDVTVVEHPGPPGRLLVSATGALDQAFTGVRGWAAALDEAVGRPPESPTTSGPA